MTDNLLEVNSTITMENELSTDTISAGPAPVTPTDRLTPFQPHHLLPTSLLQGYFEGSFLESTKEFYELCNL